MPGLADRKQGAEEDEYHISHDVYSFARGSQEINDSYGLLGFRSPQRGLFRAMSLDFTATSHCLREV